MTTADSSGRVNDLLAALEEALRVPLAQVVTAESMIGEALDAHPAHTDVLWHSLRLLRPTHRVMTTGFVYRAHVRELLSLDPWAGVVADGLTTW